MFLRRFLVMHRFKLSAAGLLAILSAGITLSLLNTVRLLATRNYGDGMANHIGVGALLLISLLLVNVLSQYVSSKLGSQLIAGIRSDISRGLIGLSCEKFFDKSNIAFDSFTQDVGRIAPLVAMVPAIAYNILITIVCSVYLVGLSPILFAVLSIGLALPVFLYWSLNKTVQTKFDLMRAMESGLFEHLRTISDGKKELSLSQARSKHFLHSLLFPAINQSETAMTNAHLYVGLLQAWSSFFIYIVLFSVLYFGNFVVKLPVNIVATFIVGGVYLTGPVTFLMQIAQQIAPGWASLRHLERLGLELKGAPTPRLAASREGVGVFGDWSNIRADALCYRFPSAEEGRGEVGPISLDIFRGEIVFVIGGNGAGKSTLLLMLCGLIPPVSGKILVDGREVDGNSEEYRGLFCGVFSDFFLFKHILGPDGQYLPDEQLELLLRRVRLEDLPRPSSGVLSSVDFSTGQRKRLALLQCMAADSDIFFFDEWAAEQDSVFRDYFYVDLISELKNNGKTVIVISHDDRYFHLADRVLEIQDGCVASSIRSSKLSTPFVSSPVTF